MGNPIFTRSESDYFATGTPRGRVGQDSRTRFRKFAADSLALRIGTRSDIPEEDMLWFSLQELARECLVQANITPTRNTAEMVGRALMSTDLPNILGDVAHRVLIEEFKTAEESWRIFCKIDRLEDFKEATMAHASEADDLDEVKERAPYNYGDFSDEGDTVKLITFGKLFAVTRQAIINDDLSALKSLPGKYGRAAARKIGDIVFSILTGNPTMGDGVSLFDDSDHGNVGASGVIGVSTVSEAVKLMGLQKDVSGNVPLNLNTRFFIAPKTVEGVAEVFYRSERFSDPVVVATDSSLASTRINPYSGNYLTRVYDARLDASDTAAYYFLARDAIVVFFLNGMEEPYLEQKDGWIVDGVEFKVRLDAAAKPTDWRRFVKNAGG